MSPVRPTRRVLPGVGLGAVSAVEASPVAAAAPAPRWPASPGAGTVPLHLAGPVVEQGPDRPFLLMDTAVHDGLDKDSGRPPRWRNLRGRRRFLRLADAEHFSFTALVAIAPQLGRAVPLPVGIIPADAAVAAVRAHGAGVFRRACARTPRHLASADGHLAALPGSRLRRRTAAFIEWGRRHRAAAPARSVSGCPTG